MSPALNAEERLAGTSPRSPQTTTSNQDSDLGFALSERKKAHQLKQQQLRQLTRGLAAEFSAGLPLGLPLPEVPEPETATDESKSLRKGAETVGISYEDQRWSSAKVQSQDATTAHFAREDNLAPITPA